MVLLSPTEIAATAGGETRRPSPASPGAVVAGLVGRARRRLRQALAELTRDGAPVPFAPAKLDELAAVELHRSLDTIFARASVLELHVARLERRLRGETPEERFAAFFEDLAQPAAAHAFLEAYPVAARQARVRTEAWLDSTLEFARRLCEDWSVIAECFSPQADPGTLVGLRLNVGDPHRGGRGVAVASFAGGLRVVYKPRSLAADAHLEELLSWLDEDLRIGFRRLRRIDRGTHGWVEFVEHEDCRTVAEVRRFYRRHGAYMAILHVLGATDFHHENVIAAGEHPVLVDLETLFHPEFVHDAAALDPRAATALRVGLLPLPVRLGAAPEAADYSGLGAPERILEQVPGWEAIGTDEMRLVKVQELRSGTHHRPRLRGTEVPVTSYADDVVRGFSAAYLALARHRRSLLAPDGPLARFADDEIRVIVRATRTYAVLLHEATHPDVLRDGADRERLFDGLRSAVEGFPLLARLVAAERADLEAGDVPIFTARAASRHLWTSAGDRVADALVEPGLAAAARRLARLGPADLERQRWVVRAALAPAEREDVSARPHRRRSGGAGTVHSAAPARADDLVAEATRLGDRIGRLAFDHDGSASWLTLNLGQDGRWSPQPMGLSLYDGVPGVALFLAQLGAVTRADRFSALARAAAMTMRRRIELDGHRPEGIGGFTGWGGVLYAMAHLGSMWNDEALLSEAVSALDGLGPLIAGDRELDLMNGSAGCLLGLLALARATHSATAIELARQCAERLLTTGTAAAGGTGWVADGGDAPLAGLAHGASGIGLALLELWAATGDDRLRVAALSAFAFERSLFSPTASNWRDARTAGSADGFLTAWCHGAPGIGLARLRALALLEDGAVRRDARAAVRATLAAGFGANHSLCHGDAGNVELLLRAGGESALRVANDLIAVVRRRGARCDTPAGLDSPELMTGLAGIGHQLLRLARPASVPSVLTLEPPDPAHGST